MKDRQRAIREGWLNPAPEKKYTITGGVPKNNNDGTWSATPLKLNEYTKDGGFIDYEPPTPEEKCMSQAHNPPAFIVLKPGKHTYKCPSCGKITIIRVPLITM